MPPIPLEASKAALGDLVPQLYYNFHSAIERCVQVQRFYRLWCRRSIPLCGEWNTAFGPFNLRVDVPTVASKLIFSTSSLGLLPGWEGNHGFILASSGPEMLA